VAVAGAAAEQTPIPLKAPSGYRDYCGRHRGCPRGGVPQALWRPLHLPTLAPSASCSAATPRTVTKRIAPVLGSGPVYFSAGAYNPTDRATMKTLPPDTSIAAGTGWTVAKAPLVAKKTLRQPLVVRGGRIDRPGELGFTGYGVQRPFSALQFPPSFAIDLGAFKAYGISVWAATPGCYALQIDGATFSRIIVFRVEFTS